MSSPLDPRTAAAVALGDFADDHDNASWDDLGMVWVDAFLLAAYACDTCNGTGREIIVAARDGLSGIEQPCPEDHVVLPWTDWADPDKCEWRCYGAPQHRCDPDPTHFYHGSMSHSRCGWQIRPQVLTDALEPK